MICPECKGLKYKTKVDFKKAVTVQTVCDKCGGTGDITDTGVRIKRLKCQVVLFEKVVEGETVSTLEIRVYPKLVNGVPEVNKNKTPIFWAEIPRMNTKPKHRKKGYMTELLESVKHSGFIPISKLVTSFDDSTTEGRKFLIKQCFKREGDNLVWQA